MTRVPVQRARGEEAQHVDALADGRLVVQRCDACGAAVWYLRTVCPVCGTAALRLTESAGRGSVHTLTTLYRAGHPDRAEDVPYTVGLVDLDEGVRIIGDLDPRAAIGDRVVARLFPDGVLFEPDIEARR